LGEVYRIGHKSTKNLPFQYRRAPVLNKTACTYNNAFDEKASDSFLNDGLAKVFSRPTNGWTGSPTVGPGSYELDYVKPRKAQTLNDLLGKKDRPIRSNGMRRPKPELERSQILSSSKDNLERESGKQQDFPKSRSLKYRPGDPKDNIYPNNLGLSGDCGDCYKSTYGSEFKGLKSLSRCHTAPANVSRDASQDADKPKPSVRPGTSCGAERKRTIRVIYSRTGV
jgi:hypothetical protein